MLAPHSRLGNDAPFRTFVFLRRFPRPFTNVRRLPIALTAAPHEEKNWMYRIGANFDDEIVMIAARLRQAAQSSGEVGAIGQLLSGQPLDGLHRVSVSRGVTKFAEAAREGSHERGVTVTVSNTKRPPPSGLITSRPFTQAASVWAWQARHSATN